MRKFETGATRDSEDGKLKYEGFFSPTVLRERARYMHRHRIQSDGTLRDPDNWQKGIPQTAYMDSMWRHFMDVWMLHRNCLLDHDTNMVESLCALMFNAEGMLHEILKDEQAGQAMFLMSEFARNAPSYDDHDWQSAARQRAKELGIDVGSEDS